MAEKIAVNTSTLNSDADSVKASLERMGNELNNLIGLKERLDTMWDGPASEVFKSEWSKDLTSLDSMIKTIQKELYEYELNAKDQYEKCEQKIYQIISSLNV